MHYVFLGYSSTFLNRPVCQGHYLLTVAAGVMATDSVAVTEHTRTSPTVEAVDLLLLCKFSWSDPAAEAGIQATHLLAAAAEVAALWILNPQLTMGHLDPMDFSQSFFSPLLALQIPEAHIYMSMRFLRT